MGANRLTGIVHEEYRLPQPPAATLPPGSFILCPMILGQGFPLAQLPCQWLIYQLAYHEAQAVVRPSLPERDLLGVWN